MTKGLASFDEQSRICRVGIPAQRVFVAVRRDEHLVRLRDAIRCEHLRGKCRHRRHASRGSSDQRQQRLVTQPKSHRITVRRDERIGVVDAQDVISDRNRPGISQAQDARLAVAAQDDLIPEMPGAEAAVPNSDPGKRRRHMLRARWNQQLELDARREIGLLRQDPIQGIHNLMRVALNAGHALTGEASVDGPELTIRRG